MCIRDRCNMFSGAVRSVRRAHMNHLARTVAKAAVPATRANSRLPGMPGPALVPGMGSLGHFLENDGGVRPTRYMAKNYQDFGKVFSMDLSTQQDEWAVICDPVLFTKVFEQEGPFPAGGVSGFRVYHRFYEEHPELAVDQSGIFKTGPEWKEARSAANPIMSIPVTSKLYPLLDKCATRTSEHLPSFFEGEYDQQEFWAYWNRVGLDMFVSVMLGVDKEFSGLDVSEHDQDNISNLARTIELMALSLNQPHTADELYPEFVDVMHKSLKYVEELTGEVDKVHPESLMGTLVRGDNTPAKLASTVQVLLTAAVDTTAGLSSWMLLNLARHPDKQDILHAELEHVLNGAHVTEATLKQLPYLKAAFRESFRFSNVNFLNTLRRLDQPITLDGIDIPAHTTLAWANHPLQNDPELVDQPHVFEPERFLPDAKKARKGTAAQAIDHPLMGPFGGGKRMCIGARIATVEIMHLMGRIFSDYRITLADASQGVDQYSLAQGGSTISVADPYPKLKFERR
eukprot:TRINITY_DN44112_c0_g1_i1.p1 TRINITY_DN44112_c0_g1~~TRINITY_DN44112_c0_g1_i1.p1  ORF type:complete len:514 (-),score=114.40 TRINITY_DN44112_c0_g1_i1:257-1798(-)